MQKVKPSIFDFISRTAGRTTPPNIEDFYEHVESLTPFEFSYWHNDIMFKISEIPNLEVRQTYLSWLEEVALRKRMELANNQFTENTLCWINEFKRWYEIDIKALYPSVEFRTYLHAVALMFLKIWRRHNGSIPKDKDINIKYLTGTYVWLLRHSDSEDYRNAKSENHVNMVTFVTFMAEGLGDIFRKKHESEVRKGLLEKIAQAYGEPMLSR